MKLRELLVNATKEPKRRRKATKEHENNSEGVLQQPNEEETNTFQKVENEQTVNFEMGFSRNGGEALWYQGFRFVINRKSKYRVYWRCEMSRKNGCAVMAVTGLEDFSSGRISPSPDSEHHKHLPKPSGVQVEQRLAKFDNRARTEPNVTTGELVTEALNISERDNEQFALMPTAVALEQRAAKRRRPFGHALNGNEVTNIVIPTELSRKDNKPFLIYDSLTVRPGSDDRIMLFVSEKALSFLRANRNWSADSTFAVCPRVFQQKFVVGAYIQHRMYPAAYALMTRKTIQHYVEVLQQLKSALGDDFIPNSVLTDFESAEIVAIKRVFPTARTQACLFHFGQTLFRRLKDDGLAKHFFSKADVRITFRRCISLAFLPPNIIRRGMAIITEQAPNGMENFLFYMAKNYIGLSDWEHTYKAEAFMTDADNLLAGIGHSTPRNSFELSNLNEVRSLLLSSHSRNSNASSGEHRSNLSSINVGMIRPRYLLPLTHDPLFQIPFWNVRNRVLDDLPRSQASMEATHLAFQKQCKRKPRMFDFLTALHKWDTKKLQEVREAQMKKLPRRRPEFIEMDRQLLHFVNSAALDTDQQITVFLDAISMALQRLEPNLQPSDGVGTNEGTSEENIPRLGTTDDEILNWRLDFDSIQSPNCTIGHDHSYI